jgi:chorismate-pyruvate lyase
MTVPLTYTLLKDWLSGTDLMSAPHVAGLAPRHRMLLLSDGSMTLELEAMVGLRVGVEVRLRGLTRLGQEDAAYLEEAADEPAVEREVWLKAGDTRLVYARSVMPLRTMEDGLLEAIETNYGEPLGRVLNSRGLPFTKAKLEAGVLRCASVAEDLGASADTPFTARRYVLLGLPRGGSVSIKASVIEIIAPALVPALPAVGRCPA